MNSTRREEKKRRVSSVVEGEDRFTSRRYLKQISFVLVFTSLVPIESERTKRRKGLSKSLAGKQTAKLCHKFKLTEQTEERGACVDSLIDHRVSARRAKTNNRFWRAASYCAGTRSIRVASEEKNSVYFRLLSSLVRSTTRVIAGAAHPRPINATLAPLKSIRFCALVTRDCGFERSKRNGRSAESRDRMSRECIPAGIRSAVSDFRDYLYYLESDIYLDLVSGFRYLERASIIHV